MNLICLIKDHDWRFAYNYNMSQGISAEEALKMYSENRTFAVHVCLRCKRHGREVFGKMILLPEYLEQRC